MAARFPVSASSVAYQIKSAWASKIHVLYWPAGADSLHRLRTGETATTIITRATSGATYNATEGLLEGASTVYFEDSISGGYGGMRELDRWAAGCSMYGDCFDVPPLRIMIGSVNSTSDYNGGMYIRVHGPYLRISDAGNYLDQNSPYGDFTDSLVAVAVRHYLSDPTAELRTWSAGTERSSGTHGVSSTSLIGDTGRPLILGGSYTGTGKQKSHWESAWFGSGAMSDADMIALSTDPSQIIEAAGGGSSALPKIIQQMGP